MAGSERPIRRRDRQVPYNLKAVKNDRPRRDQDYWN